MPFVQPEIKVFWDATAEGKLLLPKCTECRRDLVSAPVLPVLRLAERSLVRRRPGKGTIYSFTVNRRGAGDLPGYREPVPYVLAYVELAEGPRIMTNIVECDPERSRSGRQWRWSSTTPARARRCCASAPSKGVELGSGRAGTTGWLSASSRYCPSVSCRTTTSGMNSEAA